MLFRQLEYFVALAKERHFGRAAEACYVSQPSLSAAIAKLENELGVTLINRGRSFDGLTPEGERLVVWARRILAEQDAFKAEVLALQSGASGTLRLGLGPTTVAPAALLIQAFCAAHPLARVQLTEHLSGAEIQRKVRDFELDAAIAYLAPSDQTGLEVRPLYRERYVALASADFVSNETTQLTWAEASQFPLALLSRTMRVRQIVDDAFAQHDIVVEPHLETESVEALLAIVATGLSISIVPHTLSKRFSGAFPVRAIPLVKPEVSAEIVLATHTTDHTSVITRAFGAVTASLDLPELLGSRPAS